nr:hypothetical protein [Tanacetum cinerariifolium]
MKWLPKLIGYDYEVVYKQGSDNGATNALSKLENASELVSMIVSSITTDLMQRVKGTCAIILDIITALQAGQPTKKHYSWANDTLLRKGKIVVGQYANLKTELLQYFYESTIGGHYGVKKCKPDLSAYPGLLQPLPIPKTMWSQISMDFIEGLPKSQGKDVIMIVVNMLSKYAHFIGLSHPFTAAYIAQPHRQVTIRQGKQHKFSQKFYGPFEIIAKVVQVAYKLKLPAQAQIHNVFHISQLKKYRVPPVPMDSVMLPQYDKQGTLLKQPLKLLDTRIAKKGIELWGTGVYRQTPPIHVPFEVVYGQTPPIHVPYTGGLSKVDAVNRQVQTERQFAAGDMVFLKLQPHRQVTIRQDRRVAKKGNRAVVYGLVQWSNGEYLLTRDRERRQVNRPPRLEDYQCELVAYAFATAAHIENCETTNYLEAISSPECDKWVVAIEEEVESLHKNRTWELVKLLKEKRVISCKWLFKVKDGIPGVESNQYKARCKPVPTPLALRFKLSSHECPKSEEDKKDMSRVSYSSAVGSLMYAMVCTCPGLSHAVNVVSRYMHNAAIIALSTIEAEYISSTEGVNEAIWLRGMVNEFGLPQEYRVPPVPMDSVMLPQCDKQGTLLKQPLKLLDRRIAKKGIELWGTGVYRQTPPIHVPFEVVYGQTPPIHVPYTGGLSKVDAVNRQVQTERQFAAGDMVFLKLQPHRQVTIRQGKQHKFSQKFYRPFEIVAKGQVAYKLKLPAQAQIHNVFHISQLKKYRGPPVPMDSVMLPQCDKEGTLLKQPLKFLDRRVAKKGNRAVVYGLV